MTYLRGRQSCLARFLAASREFLDGGPRPESGSAAAPMDLAARIETLVQERDQCLKALDLFDRKITEAVALLPRDARTSELSELIVEFDENYAATFAEVVRTDERIAAEIENESIRLRNEALSSRREKDKVGKFKSTWVSEVGRSIDRKL